MEGPGSANFGTRYNRYILILVVAEACFKKFKVKKNCKNNVKKFRKNIYCKPGIQCVYPGYAGQTVCVSADISGYIRIFPNTG